MAHQLTDEGVPVVLYGRSARVAVKMIPLLLPEIDVVHFIESLAAARREIPALLLLPTGSGDDSNTTTTTTLPETGVGSNVDRHGRGHPPRRPRVVVIGAGIGEDDVRELMEEKEKMTATAAVTTEEKVVWTRERPGDAEGLELEENWVKDEETGRRLPRPFVLAKAIRKVVMRTLEGEEGG